MAKATGTPRKPEIKFLPVDALEPWGRNPRRHDIDRIVASIKRFGFRAPLVVNRRDGRYVVEAGHGRLLAAKRLGLKELPCVVVEEAEGEAVAYALADNRLQELTEWDLPELADILQGLDAELQAVAGWNEKELAELLESVATPKEGLIPDDEVPEPGEPICKTGDLWQLGNHRLLCGDATKREDVERLMGGKNADIVFTDPPYGISIVRVVSDHNKLIRLGSIGGAKPYGRMRQPGGRINLGVLGGEFGKGRGILGGDSGKRLAKLTGKVGAPGIVQPNLYPVITGDEHLFQPLHLLALAPVVILFGANYYASRLPDSKGWLVWDKGMSPENTFSDAELIWTNQQGHIRMYRHTWSGLVRQGSRDAESLKRLHPTQKPVGLLEQILKDFSKGNAIVLDPYLGSGSLIIASERLGRRAYGMEIEPDYCDVSISRWEAFTGQQAIKLP